MFLSHARVLIATLWVGSLWTIGFVVAPTLFANIDDRVLAGSLAGELFRIEAWISIVSATVLLALLSLTSFSADPKQRKILMGLVLAMLVCTLISHFGLQPLMAELRHQAGPAGIAASAHKSQFGMLHGISSAIYALQSLLGLALILRLR